MVFSKEFKEAISELPSKEKDKLLFRLLKKDIKLANRLLFELINTNTVDEQREIAKESILLKAKKTAESYYSIGYLNMDIRYISGEINEHVYTTKDKFGEVLLNLLMLNEVLKGNKNNILANTPNKARKFCVAVIARIFKTLILITKLDDDFFIEFEEHLMELGNHISENKYLMDASIKNGLDVNWLLKTEIPENITAIHKEIKSLGFLK